MRLSYNERSPKNYKRMPKQNKKCWSKVFCVDFLIRICTRVDLISNNKSSHCRCSIKKGVLKNLSKVTGKDLYHNLYFRKVARLRPATLLK